MAWSTVLNEPILMSASVCSGKIDEPGMFFTNQRSNAWSSGTPLSVAWIRVTRPAGAFMESETRALAVRPFERSFSVESGAL